MTNGKTLCLNMIVRNETANLQRCLNALADHIDCWVIGDTGSTDGTRDFIKSFAERKKPGELHSFPTRIFTGTMRSIPNADGSTELWGH